MEAAGLLLILFGVLAYVMIRNAREEKRRLEKYKISLKEDYGKYPPKNEKPEEFELNKALYNQEPSEEIIDDITWHDLGMDEVYKNMNFTQSAAGAEYLYWLLRSPNLDKEYREKLSKDILYFQNEEEKRVNTQMSLHSLGRISKFSLFEYLNFLDTLGKRNNTKNWIMFALLIASIAMIFVSTTYGVVAFLVIMAYQMSTYLKEKSTVEPFIATFAYIMRMTNAARDIEPYVREISISEQIKNNLNNMDNFSKNYSRLFGLNTSSGNPLDILIEYFKMISHIDLIQFNNTLNQVQEKREVIIELSKQVGYVDTIISIGAYRKSLPYYCQPEFTLEHSFEIEEGYHPLISNPVANSFTVKRGVLITGSNASGKSTFLRMTGINALLAQTIMTCTAKKYIAPEFSIYSSMALQDNLSGGESYYMVEIKSLKRILDAIVTKTKRPVLCFVDEVLRGTNTVERIAASTQILSSLASKQVFCFAATHDIELTSLLEDSYDNYHFEEEIKDDDVLFSYRLLTGKARTRNAIKLLQIIGFGEDIIGKAENQALDFMNTGEWHVC